MAKAMVLHILKKVTLYTQVTVDILFQIYHG